MEFKFLHIVAFLSVVVVASHASLPSEEYWKSVLPNTPMPQAVKDLLQPSHEWLENESTKVGAGPSGVNAIEYLPATEYPGKMNPNVYLPAIEYPDKMNPNPYLPATEYPVETQDTKPNVYLPATEYPGKMNSDAYLPATEYPVETQDASPIAALFFPKKDLHSGKKMNLQFSKTTNAAAFLPRQAADSVPFSSEKLQEIFSKFSVNPSSNKAKAMRQTIKECEKTAKEGEEKLCATSLESMVDFSTSKLGKEVKAISTKAENMERKEYRIVGVKKIPSKKPVVACHKMEYVYAVFYCHKTNASVAYEVKMVADGRLKAAAVGVCHRDTVCHFLPEDHVVWVSKN